MISCEHSVNIYLTCNSVNMQPATSKGPGEPVKQSNKYCLIIFGEMLQENSGNALNIKLSIIKRKILHEEFILE